MNLAMSDMSMMPTASRTVRCSSATTSNEAGRPNPGADSSGRSPSNHSTYSQPTDEL